MWFLIGTIHVFPQGKILADTLKVEQIAQNKGLSQLNVLDIAFDDNGYLWAGTEDGLNRFNGYEMEVLSQSGNSFGLPDDHIRGMLYTNDTLWLATNTRSIVAYVPSKDDFIPILDSSVLEENEALKYSHNIFELNDRYLLAGALKNCILIDRKTLDFAILPFPEQAQNDYLLSFHQKSENTFLLGTFFSGILKMDLSEMKLYTHESCASLEDNPVYAFYANDRNNLLIGTEKGLFRLDQKMNTTEVVQRPRERNPIRYFYDWNDDQILIGCFDGLMVMDKNTFEMRPVSLAGISMKSFSNVEVIKIKKDNGGGIWFATQGKGLLYHHPNRQKFEPSRIKLPKFPRKDFISSFNFLREGNDLWMTTEFGFVKHELQTDNYKLYRTGSLGYALTKDADNTIWGGGFNQGLQRYDRENDRFENVDFSKGSIPDRDIVQITPFSNDSLWVATWSSGMYVVHLESLTVKPLKINGESISRARTSLIDSKNRIWIGADDGLYRIENGKTKHYWNDPGNENSLSNNRIFSISDNNRGSIWVGTAKGINRIDLKTDSIYRYTEQPGLPNDFIYGILADDNGDIWASTNYGISKFDVETGKFKNYTEQDGLQNNEFNGKAAYKDSLGYLYFGGMNGFNVFHPDSIRMNKNTGKTIIEDVELFGKPIDKNIVYADTLHFQHDENVLTFSFAALNYLLPEKNRYRFKMEGFDRDWRPVTNERSTTYTNLNPGEYTFWVRGSNNELLWGQPDSLVIIIRAPWYKTVYFNVGVVLCILLLTSAWFLYRNYQQKQKNRVLQEMVRDRTIELHRTNDGLNQAVQKAKEQQQNISFLMRELNHRVKNNLQLMASLLDMQKVKTSDKITKDSLQAAQNRLFTIAKIHDLLGEAKKDDSQLDVFISKLIKELVTFMESQVRLEFDLEPMSVSPKKINPLGIVLNELVTNTIKHAFDKSQQNKVIHISLKHEGKFGVLTYRDNGVGFSEKENVGSLGLSLVRNLAVQLGGHAETKSDNGSVFIIYFVL